MSALNKYYVQQMLVALQPSLLMKTWEKQWHRRKLPWIFRVRPFSWIIPQYEYIPQPLTVYPNRLITFRRYHEKETNSKHD